jgi:hypothetical protein
MTDQDKCAILFIVDRSGSMESIRADAEGAVNAFIKDQAAQPGTCTIRVSEFDDVVSVVHHSRPAADVPTYRLIPRGSTALLDAIGVSVVDFGMELDAMPEQERPGKVIVVVQTDGHENSSTEWRLAAVKQLLDRQRSVYSWEFVFLGAGQDAIAAGTSMGFRGDSSLAYAATGKGFAGGTQSASVYVSNFRSGGNAAFTDNDRQVAAES